MEGKVVVFLRTSSVARVPVYAHLRSLGVIIVMIHPFAPMSGFNGLFHYLIAQDTNNVDEVQQVLMEFLQQHRLRADAILSFDEFAVYPAAVLAERCRAAHELVQLGGSSCDSAAAMMARCVSKGITPMPLPSHVIQQVNIKTKFREYCRLNNITSPGATVLRSQKDDIVAKMRDSNLTFPVVLKPSPGAGSLLAKLCHSIEDAQEHVAVMWGILEVHPDIKHFRALGTDVEILVEEYVGGREVDVDAIIEHGKVKFCSISDNFEVNPPYFVEQGGLCPSTLNSDERLEVRKLLDSFVVTAGHALHGVLHFEAKYDFQRKRAYVIEVNLRLGSAETNTMLVTCYNGLQLGESVVRLALGMPIDEQLARHFPKAFGLEVPSDKEAPTSSVGLDVFEDREKGWFKPVVCCASVNIYPELEGVLVRTEVPLHNKFLVDYSVSQSPGALVAPPPKTFYLLCWMVARGSTVAEAKENIDSLTREFKQEIATAQ